MGCDVKTTLLALAFCFLPVIGNAEPNLKFALDNYEKSEANDKRVIESLLVATYVGMFWSTMQLQSEGKTPLFCQPSKVALTTEQIGNATQRGEGNSSPGGHAIRPSNAQNFGEGFPMQQIKMI